MLYRIFSLTICVIIILTLSSCFDGNANTTPEMNLPHKCESICDSCGKCKDESCTEEVCKSKCDKDHVDLPYIDVEDLN
jgi:hypothetical protein